METPQEAITRYDAPEICNTDQGAEFTLKGFPDVLKKHEVPISLDGKGRRIDNVLVLRLWRSLKYKDVYLQAYESGSEARQSIKTYMQFFAFIASG